MKYTTITSINSKTIIIERSRCSFFFFNDTATTEIYTLSLHDALPIYDHMADPAANQINGRGSICSIGHHIAGADRKSTRLNSSHSQISYAVFCLKKKKENNKRHEDNVNPKHTAY